MVKGYPIRLPASLQANRAPPTNRKTKKSQGYPGRPVWKNRPIGLLPKNLLHKKEKGRETYTKPDQTNSQGLNLERQNAETKQTWLVPNQQFWHGTSMI